MLVFGCAALGMSYGLARPVPGAATLGEEEAVALVTRARASGVDTFDTSPAYGDSERRLGLALGGGGQVWTKIGPAREGSGGATHAEASVSRAKAGSMSSPMPPHISARRFPGSG